MSNTKDDGLDKSSDNLAMCEYLCRELNMDRETEELSLKKFSEVSQRFSLEGNPIHWFCCAIYSVCRTSFTPTVGGSNAVVMGNCISLNKLLRSCKMSIQEFFAKMKTWLEMANLSSEFLKQIERLERTFSISFHLCQHYNNIYDQIFACPRNEKRNTKFRSVAKCSSSKLYNLCWCLYLCAKSENPSYTVDIITSFHLLICCIDYIYVNVLAENRVDLINPDFEGVPNNWNTPSFDPNTVRNHCIIDSLCRLTETCFVDTKAMKETFWNKIIKAFIETKTLYANEETFLGVVSNENCERNLKSLNSAYEQYVLSVGEFDERIFSYKKSNTGGDGEKGDSEQKMKYHVPETPLTRRHVLPKKDGVYEPLANAKNNVKKLLENIASIVEPSEFICKAGEGTLTKINERLSRMSEAFHKNTPYETEATKRFDLAKSLYFYLLDKIVRDEIRRKPNINLILLLEKETLNTTLIACCVEIVLNAYGSAEKFPWILECFSINAFQFCKIIEIVVRQCDNKWATRELIKHLNAMEETCLESLVWKRDSPVWEIFKNCTRPLPKYSEVDIRSNILRQTDLKLQSPMNSAIETFSSIVVSDSARRDLFNTHKDNASNDTTIDCTKKQSAGNKLPLSILIFLRKFYMLAWLRIDLLCRNLEMNDGIVLDKIWTLFEYSITHTELMKDRHLDQILMCAIYIYIKVGDVPDKEFKDIMRFYRNQRQASSEIYRNVFISSEEKDGEREETYGDIIEFYNVVYIVKMTPYALDFSEKKKSQCDLLLSPHPPEKPNLPKKISNNHFIYIHHMEKNEVKCSPNDHAFEIGKSPRKFFEDFNEKQRNGKRNLNNDLFVDAEKRPRFGAPYLVNTISGMVKDRQEKRN